MFFKKSLFQLIILSLSLGLTVGTGQAQETPPWQAAGEVRSRLLKAQTELLTAARADDPAAHYQAAGLAVAEATTLYERTLQPHLVTTAPEADRSILAALVAAQTAAVSGNPAALAAARGRVWTYLLGGSYAKTLAALEAGQAGTAATWLQLREYRQATKVTTVDDATTRAVAALKAGQIDPTEAATIAGNDLRDAYFFRLREALNQLEAALASDFTTRAAEWAGQARGYFNILHSDVTAKQGQTLAAGLAEQLAALEQATLSGDKTAALAQLSQIRAGLAGYLPVELDAAEIEKRGQLLYLFTDLIYIEYKDGVRNGEITIPIEYQEAITFRDQAEAVFEELRPVMAAADSAAAERYGRLLVEMDEIMAGLGEVEAIKSRVEEALGLIESTLQVSAGAGDSESTLIVINTLLDEIQSAVAAGRYDEAERSRLEAYAMFENGMEQRLANRAVSLTRELEGLFWEGTGGQKGLATLLREKAPAEQIEGQIAQLRTKLAEANTFLAAGLTGLLAFLNSLAIIIREGLEAVLIIGAILGYLRATAAPGKYSLWVYLGVAAALALSVLTWIAARSLITISVANREMLEGITSLIAVAVLFYVTNWLFHKVYVINWLTFVKEQVSQALNDGRAIVLAGLGFTVVYREGFETVLFYQALLFDAEVGPVLLGFGVGLVIILAVSYAILKFSKRLPLKPFFTGTGILLLLLAFSLTGKGMREFQEAGVVSATLLAWIPENLMLMEGLGIFPTVETTLAQLLLLIAITVTFAISHWQGQRKPAGRPAVGQGQ